MNYDLDPNDGMMSREALARGLLVQRMKELSQKFYSEDWISGLEFDVWDMAFEGKELFDTIEVTESTSKFFRDLATLAGGWWVEQDETKPNQTDPVFIPMERWQQILKAEDASDPDTT